MTPGCPRVDRDWFQCLKLECDEPLSHFAFKFNLRRYTMARAEAVAHLATGC
jgi:hypothetical protein